MGEKLWELVEKWRVAVIPENLNPGAVPLEDVSKQECADELEVVLSAGEGTPPKPTCVDCHKAGIINCSHFNNCDGRWVFRSEDEMKHKHCVFCGEEVPVPRPSNWDLVCHSERNTTAPDTSGKRYHAVIVGRAKLESRVSFTAPSAPEPAGKLESSIAGVLKFQGAAAAPPASTAPTYSGPAYGADAKDAREALSPPADGLAKRAREWLYAQAQTQRFQADFRPDHIPSLVALLRRVAAEARLAALYEASDAVFHTPTGKVPDEELSEAADAIRAVSIPSRQVD